MYYLLFLLSLVCFHFLACECQRASWSFLFRFKYTILLLYSKISILFISQTFFSSVLLQKEIIILFSLDLIIIAIKLK